MDPFNASLIPSLLQIVTRLAGRADDSQADHDIFGLLTIVTAAVARGEAPILRLVILAATALLTDEAGNDSFPHVPLELVRQAAFAGLGTLAAYRP